VTDPRAEYARLRAVIELRLADLREALDRHEADRPNWTRIECLECVERGLAELVEEAAKL
jgi:hypothetical protein